MGAIRVVHSFSMWIHLAICCKGRVSTSQSSRFRIWLTKFYWGSSAWGARRATAWGTARTIRAPTRTRSLGEQCWSHGTSLVEVSCQCHASWHWSMDVHGDPILVLTRNSGLLWRLWQREFAETLFEREPWLHSSEQMWAVISALARTSRKRDNFCTEVTSISCHKWYDSMRTILCLVVFVAQMKMQPHASARSAPGSCRIFSTAGKAVSSRPGWVMLCLSYAACDFLRIGHIRMKCMDIPGNHDGGWSIFASLLDPCWPLLVLQDPETTIHVVAGTITFLPLGLAVFAASTCALTAQSSSA